MINMTLRDLFKIVDESSDVVIYYNSGEPMVGSLEDMNFRDDIDFLLDRAIMRIEPAKAILNKNYNYFNVGDVYLEIELF